MKKVILIATICIAGLVSAKNGEEMKPTKEKKEVAKATAQAEEQEEALKAINCRTVGMYVWCNDEMLSDTVCWGEGSGTATEAQAMAQSLHNAQLVNEFFCGGQP
ncbi:hypothetical protein IW15_19345 [Chryseobacterium soli]|uniref:Uncharacterized protein n=1 Tax=Chryseobacterium soli TaxID=445961 RepID=A0A086A1D3_9FLAO|nr:hypothetical protein [Chryseobacterium soli]KFF10497.1 hypothetical protein IW15_19345 [Chryseobacterium soli]